MRISKLQLAAIKREFKKKTERERLKGLSHQTLNRPRGFKGCKLGPASAGRTLNNEEKSEIEQQMRDEGKL